MTLRQIDEFGFIRKIEKQFFSLCVPLGIGDDAAAVIPSPRQYTLVTTDTLMEQVHFDLALSNYFQIGYKAVSVNVSDIAAMGGIPRFFLVSLAVTKRETAETLNRLYRGIQKGSKEMGLSLIGGNTVCSKRDFSISLTVLGEIPKKEMVTRGGAKADDLLYLTGTLGDAAAGLKLLKQGSKQYPQLVNRYQSPRARWQEGRLLARHAIASAMIDISDGLSSDLNRMVEASKVGAELELNQLPVSASLRRYMGREGKDPMPYVLHGGEDYELLFSVPPKKVGLLEALMAEKRVTARRIGRIVTGKKVMARDLSGKRYELLPSGYDHFKGLHQS